MLLHTLRTRLPPPLLRVRLAAPAIVAPTALIGRGIRSPTDHRRRAILASAAVVHARHG